MAKKAGGVDPLQESDAPIIGASEIEGAFALLADMTRGFAESMDLEATLGAALESIADHLEAEAGSLWLLDLEKSELQCRASVGPNPITGISLPQQLAMGEKAR